MFGIRIETLDVVKALHVLANLFCFEITRSIDDLETYLASD